MKFALLMQLCASLLKRTKANKLRCNKTGLTFDQCNSVSVTHAEKQQGMTGQGHCFRHSPSTVEVTLSQATIFRQRRWIEPKRWQAPAIAVSLITIVTVGERAKGNLSVSGIITEHNFILVHSQL